MAIDKAVDSTILDGYFGDIADAIRDKDGTQNTYTPAQMPQAIEDIPSGGVVMEESDVNFYDYDGSVFKSYKAADFLALSSMPENPSHEGLTSQGWNWLLSEAQDYVTAHGKLNIGQMYVTDDGKTRLYCHFDEYTLHPYLSLCPSGTIIVDWGDGSATETMTGTSTYSKQWLDHEYAKPGDYVISLEISSGKAWIDTVGMTSQGILNKSTTTTSNVNDIYYFCLEKVELGTGVDLGRYAFNNCINLKTITMPSSARFEGANCFRDCKSLVHVTIPRGITLLYDYLFQACHSMTSISIPNTVTRINNNVFNQIYSLTSLTIPDSVTYINSSGVTLSSSIKYVTVSNNASIQSNNFASLYTCKDINIPENATNVAYNSYKQLYNLKSITIPSGVTEIPSGSFTSCISLSEMHLKPTTPPTLGGTFTSIQPDAVFYVPQGCLEAYQTATNWATYASQMQEEPS